MTEQNGQRPIVVVEKVGLGYRAQVKTITMTLGRLRDSRDGLHGELVVRAQSGYEIYHGGFNVSSLPARTAASKYLAQRWSEITISAWPSFVEAFCGKVLTLHREGTPFTTIGGPASSARPASPMLLRPIVWAGAPTLLYGPGGVGKSTLAAAAAASTHTGEEVVPGWKPQDIGAVLVLDWEDAASEWDGQLRAVCRGAGIQVPDLHYRRMAGALADHVEQIAAFVDQNGIALVIVDSVEAACGSGVEQETYNARAERYFDALRVLETASLSLDHVAGAAIGQSDPVLKSIGGIRKRDRARAVFELSRQTEGRERIELVIRDTKRNRRAKQEDQGVAIEFSDFDSDGRAGFITFSRCGVDASQSAAAVDRIEALLLAEGAKSTAEIALALSLSADTVRRTIHRHSGRITRLEDGRYGAAAR